MTNGIKIYTTQGYKKQALDFLNQYELKKIADCPETELSSLLPQKERICRFCGQVYPKVTFKNKAHVIPAFLGNRYLINDFECDSCNSIMSLYEKHLSDYLGVSRVFNFSANKNKFPKLTSGDGQFFAQRYNFNNTPLIRMEGTMPGLFKWSSTDNSISIEIPKVKYIPQYVYRSLVKIGLSLIDKNELKDYSEAFKFLVVKNKHTLTGITMLNCYIANFSVWAPYALLFQKKHSGKVLPTHFLFLYYGSMIIQIMLPLNRNDLTLFSKNGNVLDVPVPAPFYFFPPPDENIFQNTLDLSSLEYKEDDVVTWHMKFDENSFKEISTFDPQTGLINMSVRSAE